MLKFSVLIAKKMFPFPLIFIRAEFVFRSLGIRTSAAPLFGTPSAKIIGKLNPQSVDNEITNSDVFTGI